LDVNTIFVFCQKMDIICYVNNMTFYKINKIIKNDYKLKHINDFRLYNIPNNVGAYFIKLKHF